MTFVLDAILFLAGFNKFNDDQNKYLSWDSVIFHFLKYTFQNLLPNCKLNSIRENNFLKVSVSLKNTHKNNQQQQKRKWFVYIVFAESSTFL